MRRCIGTVVVAFLFCILVVPQGADAQRRRKVPVRFNAAATLKISKADTAAANALRKGLSEKQSAALKRLGLVMLQDARQAAKQGKREYPIISRRLRPYVVAIGSTDVAAVTAASMMSAAAQAEAEIAALRARQTEHLSAIAAKRAEIAKLRESKMADTRRLAALEGQLQSMENLSKMLQLQLQDAMNKQQQLMQILSNIMKNQHDTLKAIIQNMR